MLLSRQRDRLGKEARARGYSSAFLSSDLASSSLPRTFLLANSQSMARPALGWRIIFEFRTDFQRYLDHDRDTFILSPRKNTNQHINEISLTTNLCYMKYGDIVFFYYLFSSLKEKRTPHNVTVY